MDPKFKILALISTLLVAGIYGSSIPNVLADVSCIDFDKKTKICVTTNTNDMYNCVKQNDGKWKCTISSAKE